MNKEKLVKILCYLAIALLILFTVITSIVITVKKNDLDKIKDKNDQLENVLVVDNNVSQNSLNFMLKNIDN